MEKDKVEFLKEKKLRAKANKEKEFLENNFVQNPIKAKFLSFQKTKKEITVKDLF